MVVLKKVGVFLSVCLILFSAIPAIPAFAAIARDVAVSGGSVTATSLTYSHTTSGSDRLLVVTYQSGTSADRITGITYGGVAMTKLGSSLQNTRFTGYYYLLNPSLGANNVVLTGSTSDVIEAYSASYTGVNQTGNPEASTSNNNGLVNVAGGASLTSSVTTLSDNAWLIMSAWSFQDGISAGANTTSFNGTNSGFYDSNGAKSPPGSFSLAVTAAGSTRVSEILAAFSPSVAPFVPTPGVNMSIINSSFIVNGASLIIQ